MREVLPHSHLLEVTSYCPGSSTRHLCSLRPVAHGALVSSQASGGESRSSAELLWGLTRMTSGRWRQGLASL